MNIEIQEKGSVRLFTFDGTKSKYPVWSSKFKAACAVKGVLDALDPNFKTKLPASEATPLNESDNGQKAQKRAKAQNALAINFLTCCFDKPRLLAKIEASKSDDWPTGLACVVWESLEKQYKPKDTIAVAEQLTKLMGLKLKKNQDPDELGDEMANYVPVQNEREGENSGSRESSWGIVFRCDQTGVEEH